MVNVKAEQERVSTDFFRSLALKDRYKILLDLGAPIRGIREERMTITLEREAISWVVERGGLVAFAEAVATRKAEIARVPVAAG